METHYAVKLVMIGNDPLFFSFLSHSDRTVSRQALNRAMLLSISPNEVCVRHLERSMPIKACTPTDCCFSMSCPIQGFTSGTLWVLGKAIRANVRVSTYRPFMSHWFATT